jgi:uncharacterized alpha-E superfamily protein
MHSLHFIRENVRTARDVIPEKAWELICELSIYAQDNLDQGIKRRSRLEFLENIVKGCSQINGLIQSTMPRDAGWEFMLIGCNLERADMTSRYLEAGLAAILQVKDENTINSQQIIWGSVLRSLDATQYYLRATKTPVKGQAVLPYLLRDSCFPKSITYCVGSIIQSCQKLPEPELALEKLKKVESKLAKKIDYEDLGDALLEKLNKLQIMLTSIHFIISESWFIADH